MNIQSKLSITFILLLVFGVTAISSYSIVFIRGYLMMQGEEDMQADARQILLSFQAASATHDEMIALLRETGQQARYDVSIFDQYGEVIDSTIESAVSDSLTITAGFSIMESLLLGGETSVQLINEKEHDRIYVYGILPTADRGIYFVEISRLKSEIFKPIKTIRWIIYSGMFISIAIILFVSFIFSQYLSRPILQITDASEKIADGNTSYRIDINRKDEFGKLADSLNRMADKLRAENEKLVQANEKQRQFYADITHEIRNPLHTIMGTLEMLELDSIPAETRKKYIKSALNQSERLNRLFNDLAMLQRSELDKHFYCIEPFVVSELTKKLEHNYQTILAGKPVTLEIHHSDVGVHGDKNKIEQVLDNLLTNAIKYTPKGKIILKAERAADKVKITIEDTGIGIEEKHLPHIFERFYRTDKARSRDSGGTGLGLAVVKSILQAHNADLKVESQLEKGTKISFELRAVE